MSRERKGRKRMDRTLLSWVPGYSSSTGRWYHHRSQILHSLLNTAPAKQKCSSQITRSPIENTRRHCWLTTRAPELSMETFLPACWSLNTEQTWKCRTGLIPRSADSTRHSLPASAWSKKCQRPAQPSPPQRLEEEQYKRRGLGNSSNISRRTSPHTYQKMPIR